MTKKSGNSDRDKRSPDREDRLKEALRANLARRKKQARIRKKTGNED